MRWRVAYNDTLGQGIAITGASGLVGRGLVALLKERGHRVHALKRMDAAMAEDAWNVKTGEIQTSGKVDVVVNLAGRNIAARWSAKVKKEVWDSRVLATEKLCGFLAGMPTESRPALLISASATGIYGNRGDEPLTETSRIAEPGTSFLSDICRAWEEATKRAEDAGIRVVHVRIGVVLAKAGGVLAKMRGPVRMGLGGPVGKGTQFMPWVGLMDLQRLLLRLVEGSEECGPINAVAGAVRQHEFMRTLGRVLHRPTIFPMPGFVVKTLFGQMGREVLLGSQRVERGRMPAGFEFSHPGLEAAMRAELGSRE